MERFLDSTKLSQCQSQLRRPIPHLPGAHDAKQDARLLGAGPAQGIEPPAQTETDSGVDPIAETVSRPDLRRVFPSLVCAAIVGQLIKLCNLQLPNERLQYRTWYLQRVFEERTEKSHGGQLQGVAKTGEVPTLEVNPFQIVVVQVKIARQFDG